METKEVKKVTTFSLPDELVTVKFIPRKRGMAAEVEDNHVIAGAMLTNSVKRFFAPLKKNGGIANVLTNAEKEYLEEVTGQDLSVYGKFWEEFSVKLYKEDTNNLFRLSDPMDYIAIRLLETVEDEVANSWASRNDKPTYQFAITRETEITDEKKAKFDAKKEAWKAYGKIEDDKEKLLSVLKLLTNKAVSADSKLKWVQSQVEEQVDTKPDSFLAIVSDPSFETKALINKGIETKVIVKKGNRYYTIDGLELAEEGEVASFDNAVKYLESDRNQDVRALVEAKIDQA